MSVAFGRTFRSILHRHNSCRHCLQPMTDTIRHPDGRVELVPAANDEIRASSLYNEDLAPVPIERRNWTTYNYAALWISMAHCIPTYMLSSGLISAGMNWAGADYDSARQHDCAGSHPAELASWHEIWNSVSS